MRILGIESSCDETSVAIVEKGEKILSHITYSQAAMHAAYGGVFPEMASREHLDQMIPCIDQALAQASLTFDDIDALAVASAPGLMGSLLMGTTCAQTLGFCLDKPVIPVNHVEAHLYAATMGNEKIFPALGIVLSGGHTTFVKLLDGGNYEIISQTVDDAVGEAFDKVASLLGLPYPGGPHIERIAKDGDPKRFPFTAGRVKKLPNHFSLSGLKTSVLYAIQKLEELSEKDKADIAASFQRVVFEDIYKKAMRVVEECGLQALYFGGGVVSNGYLKNLFETAPYPVFFPEKELTLDNGAMIAGLAFHKEPAKEFFAPHPRSTFKQKNVER